MPPGTGRVLGSVGFDRSGSAIRIRRWIARGSSPNVSQPVAGALGLALLATIATSHSAGLSRAGHGVDAALVGGYHLGFEFGAGALVLSLILVVTVLRKHVPRPAPGQPLKEGAQA